MVATSGINHAALICSDMKRTVAFYEQALGMKLTALIEMHGVAGAKHCFLDAGNGAQLSFVEFAEPRPGTPGVSYPEHPAAESPVTTLHHLAFNVETTEELQTIREQIKAAGVRVSPPVDHGFCTSIYFDDPDGFHCEVTTYTRAYGAEDLDRSLLDRKLMAQP